MLFLSLSLARELKQHLSLPLGGHELFKRTYYQRAFFAFSTFSGPWGFQGLLRQRNPSF